MKPVAPVMKMVGLAIFGCGVVKVTDDVVWLRNGGTTLKKKSNLQHGGFCEELALLLLYIFLNREKLLGEYLLHVSW